MDSPLDLGSGGAAQAGGGQGTGGAGPTGGGGGVSVTATPLEFCDDVCADLHIHSCSGAFCEQLTCTRNASDWDGPTRDAFAVCMTEDPLCFTTLEGCMLDVLFPPPALRVHRLVVENIEGSSPHHVWAGAYAPNQPEEFLAHEVTSETTVSFIWEKPWWGDSGPAFGVWLDLDRDGLCESGEDRFAGASGVWTGSLQKPEYDAQASEYHDSGAAVCPTLGFEDVGVAPSDG